MKKSLLNRLRHLLVLVCVLPIMAGCGGSNKLLLRNQVRLADIQVVEMRTLETTFQAGLRVLNPAETNLMIKGISCELKVDGRPFATGLSSIQYEIPPYGTAIIQVPVYASTLDMVTSMLIRLRQAGEGGAKPISYELSGHVLILQGTSTTSKKMPFVSQGDLVFDGNQP